MGVTKDDLSTCCKLLLLKKILSLLIYVQILYQKEDAWLAIENVCQEALKNASPPASLAWQTWVLVLRAEPCVEMSVLLTIILLQDIKKNVAGHAPGGELFVMMEVISAREEGWLNVETSVSWIITTVTMGTENVMVSVSLAQTSVVMGHRTACSCSQLRQAKHKFRLQNVVRRVTLFVEKNAGLINLWPKTCYKNPISDPTGKTPPSSPAETHANI